MRNILPLLLVCLFSSASLADIIRVNNNNGISADFASIQQAIDSANIGDTIYLEPSSTSYGNFTFNKAVSIYGPGYFLAQNAGLQANVNTSKVGNITWVGSGSFGSISGIEIQGTLNISAGNIAITRCYFSGSTLNTDISFVGTGSFTNVLIAQNYITGRISNDGFPNTFTVFFRNNIITGDLISLDPTIVCDFTNNYIQWSNSSYYVYNSSFVNNIFNTSNTNWNPASAGFNNGFENNIFRSTTVSADSALGNQLGVNTSVGTIFTGGTSDGRWQIIPGSAADGTGKEIPSGTPTDIGPYGGPNPYKLSGIPAIPTIYDLVVPTSNTTGGLNVTIKARSED